MNSSAAREGGHESGAYLHGTQANLGEGDLLMPGYASNFEEGRSSNHIYFAKTLDAATWGAELAVGKGRGRICFVEPTGAIEDDPNVTDKKFPGNPTQSYRSAEPVCVVGELVDWVRHSADQVHVMKDRLEQLKLKGEAIIFD